MSNVITIDETPICLDMLSSTTVNEAAASSITIRSTGHEKYRVTVCLAAKAKKGKNLSHSLSSKVGKEM